MKVNCSVCGQGYDDTYASTVCPHDSFQMHCGVIVNGKHGCAHTLAEQAAAACGELDEPPNPDCPTLHMIEAVGVMQRAERGEKVCVCSAMRQICQLSTFPENPTTGDPVPAWECPVHGSVAMEGAQTS